MKGWTIAVVAGFSCLFALACAHARESETEEACTARSARRVAVRELASDPDRHLGRCISVRGFWVGKMLYADEGAYYAAPLQGDSGDGFVGVYGAPLNDIDQPGFARVRFVGTVHTWAQVWGPGVIMMGGFCHSYLEEAFIDAVSVHGLRPAQLVRRVRDSDRRLYGDLAFMPADWPQKSEMEALALRWLEAIGRRDIGLVAELHNVSMAQARADAAAREDDIRRMNAFQYMFSVEDSPFADFRRPRAPLQMAMFVRKRRGETAPAPRPNERENFAVACFCRTEDCSGRWPISTLDSANAASRPFICTNVDFSSRTRRALEPQIDWRLLSER